MIKRTTKKNKRQLHTLKWIRAVRNKSYEDWCDDPIGFEKARKKREEEYIKLYGCSR